MIHPIHINICSNVRRYVRGNTYVYRADTVRRFSKYSVLVCMRSFSISVRVPLHVCYWMFCLETGTCIHGRSISANNLVLRSSIPTWINRRLFFFLSFFLFIFSPCVFLFLFCPIIWSFTNEVTFTTSWSHTFKALKYSSYSFERESFPILKSVSYESVQLLWFHPLSLFSFLFLVNLINISFLTAYVNEQDSWNKFKVIYYYVLDDFYKE